MTELNCQSTTVEFVSDHQPSGVSVRETQPDWIGETAEKLSIESRGLGKKAAVTLCAVQLQRGALTFLDEGYLRLAVMAKTGDQLDLFYLTEFGCAEGLDVQSNLLAVCGCKHLTQMCAGSILRQGKC